MRKVLKIVSLLLIILIPYDIYSQDISDSLKTLLKSSKDTSRVNVLNQLGNYYSERDAKLSNKYSTAAISLSEKLNFQKGKAVALNNIGIVYDVIGDYKLALLNYNLALNIAKTICIEELEANINNNIGLVYWNKGEYEQALKIYLYSLRIFEKINHKKGLANVLSNIGLIYEDINNHEKSLIYQLKSLKIREETNDLYGIGVSLTNIGLLYMNTDKNDLAIKYLEKSIVFKKRTEDIYGLAISYNNLGTSYIGYDNKKALDYLFRALSIKEKLNDEYGLITVYNNLANIYSTFRDFNKALSYSQKALKLAEKLQSRHKLKMVYNIVSKLYQKLNKPDLALLYYTKFDSIKDLIYSIESAKSISEMQTKYESEKKEHIIKLKSAEAKNQKNKNKIQLLLFLGLVIFIIFTAIFIFYFYKQFQKAHQIMEKSKQDKLIFKAVIDSEDNERKRIAQELHDGLGQLLCTSKMNVSSLDDIVLKSDEKDISAFRNSIGLIDEAIEEVRNISHNLMPVSLIDVGLETALQELIKKINSAGKLQVDFKNVEADLNLEETGKIAIYRIIQEILNNIIKHSEAKNVIIQLHQSSDKILLNISDDGKGIELSKITESKGIGWKNIYSRVSMLNGNIEIKSEKGLGTKIFITLTKI